MDKNRSRIGNAKSANPFRQEAEGITPEMLVVATVFLASLGVSYVLMPKFLGYLRARGLVVPDRYKAGHVPVVTHAGLLGLGVAVAALVITLILRPPPLFLDPFAFVPSDAVQTAQVALFTICGYGIVGAVDDRHSLSHLVKAGVPLTLGLPAAGLALGRMAEPSLISLIPVLSAFQGAILLVVIPVYILVVTNLCNMHSGFNGLQSGLSLILLGTLILRLGIDGRLEENLPLVLVAGGVAAFLPFNRYPAKVIEGNVGSFLVGATIGVGMTTNGWLLAGIVMMAPHILDFLLFAYVKLSGRPFVKFGRLRADGTIESPYPFKLKFVLPYYFRLTERQAVRLLYLLTLAVCAASLAVPF